MLHLSIDGHDPTTFRAIHAAVVFLPRTKPITVNAQNHHLPADGAHRNGVRLRRGAKRSCLLYFCNGQLEEFHQILL